MALRFLFCFAVLEQKEFKRRGRMAELSGGRGGLQWFSCLCCPSVRQGKWEYFSGDGMQIPDDMREENSYGKWI